MKRDRAVAISEPLLRDDRGAMPEIRRRAAFARPLGERGLIAQQIAKGVVLATQFERADERAGRRRVTGRLVQALAQDRRGLVGLTEVDEEPSCIQPKLEPPRDRRRRDDLAFPKREQITGARRVDLNEPFDGPRVLGLLVEQRVVERSGARCVPEAVERRLGGAVTERARRVAGERQRGRRHVQLDDAGVLPLRVVDAYELVERPLDVLRRRRRRAERDRRRRLAAEPPCLRERHELVEDRLGERAIADGAERDLGRFSQQIEIAAGRLRQSQQAVDERTPAVTALKLRERGEDRRVDRVVGQRALVRCLRRLGIAPSIAVPLGDLRLQSEGDARGEIASVGDRRGERRGQRIPRGWLRRARLGHRQQRRIERSERARRVGDHLRHRVPSRQPRRGMSHGRLGSGDGSPGR